MSIDGIQKRIKDIRIEKKLTIKDLSEHINVPERTISGYERGERKVACDYIVALSTHLSINTNWLLLGKGDKYLSEAQSNSINIKGKKIGDMNGLIGGHNNGTININVNKLKDNKEALDIMELLEDVEPTILHKIKGNLINYHKAKSAF